MKKDKKSKKTNYKVKKGIYKSFIWILLILISLVSFYPIWYIFVGAFSDPNKVQSGVPLVFPKGFSGKLFKANFNTETLNALGNTFFITIFGAGLSIILTILCAYVLAQKKLPGVKFLTIVVMLTIWLKPGMIAIFQNIQTLNLKGHMLGIILPFSFSAFNVILLRTSFMGVPQDMIESAELDGASKFKILTKIMIPSAKPALITVSLFHVIDRWNGYFWSELLLKQEQFPMQVFIKGARSVQGMNQAQIMANSYSLILIAILPVLFIFPLIQNSFRKGIMSGAIK